jgi:hypothetical protein
MAWYKPLQNQKTGKWFMGCVDGSGAFDIAPCDQRMSCPKCRADIWRDLYNNDPCEYCDNLRFVDKPNACPGHASSEEAYEHYQQHKLEKSVAGVDNETQKKCAICGVWTNRYMAYGDSWWMDSYYLCEDHLTIKYLEQAIKNKNERK